ncbi:MAG: tRNA glutamyl-Q(34) synthetase GluQRS [Desulfuromonadales bacterium]|nr:tRNA glutamyl-Q(34) synthetase GluQRS [Desulfuromonadales bacterium]
MKIVGRFAPSPTGPLHIGSLFTALGSYLLAKSKGGEWFLRIDDLDKQRVIPEMMDDIFRTLEFFGFEWDREPIWQSKRDKSYQQALEVLKDKGLIYMCGCSRAEIARIATAPHGSSEELFYPGTCRNGIEKGKILRAARVRVPNDLIKFNDKVVGRYQQNLGEICGDFVVKRADGPFAYHLATVVDDFDSGVNQVVRGGDLLYSTPRQIYLQRVLGYPQPEYYHLPLILSEGGSKLSKRDNAISLMNSDDLLKRGNFLLKSALKLLGQRIPASSEADSPREILQYGITNFDFNVLPKVDSLKLSHYSKSGGSL